MAQKLGAIWSQHSLRRRVGIPSGPLAFEVSRLFRWSRTSSTDTSMPESCRSEMQTRAVFTSEAGRKTLEKYLFKSLALPAGFQLSRPYRKLKPWHQNCWPGYCRCFTCISNLVCWLTVRSFCLCSGVLLFLYCFNAVYFSRIRRRTSVIVSHNFDRDVVFDSRQKQILPIWQYSSISTEAARLKGTFAREPLKSWKLPFL